MPRILLNPASAPSELLMPGTASAAASAAAARATSCSVVGLRRIHEIERKLLRRRGGFSEACVGILGHHPRHRHCPLGQIPEAGRIDSA